MTVTPEQRTRIRSTDRERTRQLLVDAAVEVFAEVGFVRATVDQIATKAGASRATFYLHFRTKTDILPDLVARSGEAYTPHYGQLAKVIGAADRDAIRDWVFEATNTWGQVSDLMRPVYEAVAGAPELAQRCFGERVPGLRQMSEALSDVMDTDSPRGQIFAEVLFAPLTHYFSKFLRGEDFDRAMVAEVIADTWVSAALHRPRNT